MLQWNLQRLKKPEKELLLRYLRTHYAKLGNRYAELVKLALQFQTRKSRNKPDRVKLIDTEQSILEQIELIDVVMFIPLSQTIQVRLSIIKRIVDKSLWLILQKFELIEGLFRPKDKIEIPLEYMDQLLIRIKRLHSKQQMKNYHKEKNKFELKL